MAYPTSQTSRRLYSAQKSSHLVQISGVVTGFDEKGRSRCTFWGRSQTATGHIRNIPCVVIGRNLDRMRHLILDGATIAATGVYELASPQPGKARPFHLIWANSSNLTTPAAVKSNAPRRTA